MIEVRTMREARAVMDAALIVHGAPIRVYVAGEKLPDEVQASLDAVRKQLEPVSEIEQLKARISALEARR